MLVQVGKTMAFWARFRGFGLCWYIPFGVQVWVQVPGCPKYPKVKGYTLYTPYGLGSLFHLCFGGPSNIKQGDMSATHHGTWHPS